MWGFDKSAIRLVETTPSKDGLVIGYSVGGEIKSVVIKPSKWFLAGDEKSPTTAGLFEVAHPLRDYIAPVKLSEIFWSSFDKLEEAIQRVHEGPAIPVNLETKILLNTWWLYLMTASPEDVYAVGTRYKLLNAEDIDALQTGKITLDANARIWQERWVELDPSADEANYQKLANQHSWYEYSAVHGFEAALSAARTGR